MPRLELGQLSTTPGALDLFMQAGTSPAPFIERHANGDWGELDEHDQAANRRAVEDGSRVLSQYSVHGEIFWIITESDRSRTTLLLPSEY